MTGVALPLTGRVRQTDFLWGGIALSLNGQGDTPQEFHPQERRRADFSGNSVFIDPDIRFQQILGFGGALTESSGVALSQLPLAAAVEELRAYFCPDTGNGYSFCRIHLNSCDFSLGNYSCLETPGDRAMASFQIDRFREHVLPWLRIAKEFAGSSLKILVSPWSPPPWMKTNGQMNGGGRLLPEWRDVWAQCYVRFALEMKKEGLPVWGFTVQNEPDATQTWDSCLYGAEEERDFVRDHLGPALEEAGLADVKIIVWDHNRDQLVQRAAVIYADKAASRFIWGSGFHWYADDCFENVARHREAWPDKHLLFTEGCQEGGPHADSPVPALRYAKSIIRDINHGAEGWIDWNLFLDETGGPNHVGNLCSAPVLVDRTDSTARRQPSWHVLRQFSRLIKPGARRILCAPATDRLECLGVRNQDGSLAVLALNLGNEAFDFFLRSRELEWSVRVPGPGLVALHHPA
jgi:glucosylceramidase